jgi:hypothetical protein
MSGGSRPGAPHRSWEGAGSGPPWLELELADGGQRGSEGGGGGRRHGLPAAQALPAAAGGGREGSGRRDQEPPVGEEALGSGGWRR